MLVFHILLFQLLASISWSGGSLFVVSITLLTHAGLSLLEQYAAVWTQRRPAGAYHLQVTSCRVLIYPTN